MHGINKNPLSKIILKHIHWYNHEAKLHHQGRLSLTWVKYVLHLAPNQWNLIKHGTALISDKSYKVIIKALKLNEQQVFHHVMPVHHQSNKSIGSFSRAKANMSKILSSAKDMSHKMVITMIKAQKRKGRYNIYINGHYAFPVGEDVLVKYRLHKGEKISARLKKTLNHADIVSKMHHTALRFIGKQLRTKHEVAKKLYRSYPDDDPKYVNLAIKRLQRESLIDDQHYANAYTRTVQICNFKGPLKITSYLKYKGIPDFRIKKALHDFYPHMKQIQIAEKIAEDQYRLKQNQPFQKRINKVKLSIARKGFSFDVASEAVQKCGFQPDYQQQDKLLQKYVKRAYRRYQHTTKNSYKLRQKILANVVRKGFHDFDEINAIIDNLVNK